MAPLTGVVVTDRVPVSWAFAEVKCPNTEKMIMDDKTAGIRIISFTIPVALQKGNTSFFLHIFSSFSMMEFPPSLSGFCFPIFVKYIDTQSSTMIT
jgi:hypothetical protein